MSSGHKIMAVGATGLVGSAFLDLAGQRESDDSYVALARRPSQYEHGPDGPVRHILAPAEQWAEMIAEERPDKLFCALGTTIKQAGSQSAFKDVDYHLILQAATAAKRAGVQHYVLVSSVAANPNSGNFYLRTKGETEQAVRKLNFAQLDILRPGLLRGKREGPFRLGEHLSMIAAPLMDNMLIGSAAKYRSVLADDVARCGHSLFRSSRRESDDEACDAATTIYDHRAIMRLAGDYRD